MIRVLIGFGMLLLSAIAFAGVDVECWDGDCLHKGWTIQVHHSNQFMEVACRQGDCAAKGWIAQGNAWQGTYTSCKKNGCFVAGWYEMDRLSQRLIRQISCVQQDGVSDCLRFGWTTYEPNVYYETTCRGGDCRIHGWDTILPGYRLRRASCLEGGCFVGGWVEGP